MEDILKKLKEPLRIDQIDFRIHSISAKGFATILAYKDARTDMNRLDEVCGAMWQDKYELIDGQLFCSIGIKIENEWIWRQDVGIESNTEATKGRASDAFKRAGFRWGIGRELYDYPRIQMTLKPNEFKVENNKGKQTFDLKLDKWEWKAEFEEEKIKRLTAYDNHGALRFDSLKDFNAAPSSNQTTPALVKNTKTPAQNKPATSTPDAEKRWLNKMKGKDFTKAWLGVVNAINNNQITSIDQVRKYYKVSAETEAQLQELFNYQSV